MCRHVWWQQQPPHRLWQQRDMLHVRHSTAYSRRKSAHPTRKGPKHSNSIQFSSLGAWNARMWRQLAQHHLHCCTACTVAECSNCTSTRRTNHFRARARMRHRYTAFPGDELPSRAPRQPHLATTHSYATFSQLSVTVADRSTRLKRKGYTRKCRRSWSTGRGRPQFTSCSCWGVRPTSSLTCRVHAVSAQRTAVVRKSQPNRMFGVGQRGAGFCRGACDAHAQQDSTVSNC